MRRNERSSPNGDYEPAITAYNPTVRFLTGWVLPVNTQLLKLVKGRQLLLNALILLTKNFGHLIAC
jgi:hypothetical protein